MVTTAIRADEIIPGDRFDTRTGIGTNNEFKTVTHVRYIECDEPGSQDRVEIRYDSDCIHPVRTLLAGSLVRVAA